MGTKTIKARPAGHRADGSPIGERSYVIDREPEPFGEGRSRIFFRNG